MNAVTALYFSPAGTTAKVAETIAETLAEQLGRSVERRAFTKPAEREREYCFTESDIVVIASPTYAGKLPNKILPDFREKLRGNGAAAIPVVTFGNRAYDNSLAELCAVLTENGFRLAAAGAFVCRHAFTDELAYGRPGWSDSFEMKTFAKKAADKIKRAGGALPPLAVPGDANAPYYVPRGLDGQPAMFLKAKPKTHLSRCNRCGACVRSCPMGAIDPRDPAHVPGTCIKCQSCVRKCTKRAKYFDDPAFLSHVAMLERDYAEPKENEVFL
ncbi:MAG: ferredoxin [Ruminococcaceae bacterium]|nr:ferredoxin [Oscillospiraceae bacterium]